MIEKGKGIFRDSPYDHQFIESSLYNIPEEESIYDLAICHAVMMHLDHPQLAIQEMKRVVKQGGLIIAIESNWNAANALSCIDGLHKRDTTDLGFLQQLFEDTRQQKKNDGNIGIKMPILLYKEGLKDIQAKTSDCVNVLVPSLDAPEREKLYTSLGHDGFGHEITEIEFKKKVTYFMENGFSKDESEKHALMEKICVITS